MTLRLAPLALVAALAWPAASQAADYTIDTKGAHASINFRIKHLGFSWLVGRFDQFNGTFSYDEKAPETSKVSVEIDTASVSSNHAERDKHLRNTDFLDVAKFPKATFVSKSVSPAGDGKAKIVGDLTLRGVTKEVTIDAAYVGGGADPWGGNRVGFTGTTKIALADYGINFNLGPASKDVELQLEVEGVQK
ncbi:YceI family protein [Hyphomicrobium sp.]|uniref:YceI family protein n=1 Tax=Hyphomicrobium sp. TaxID=82 RepID=UPI002E3655B8|nr:YceI family protein [Hyphomicrobium sp.]HEX2840838.1 YceI family protein [Hyphomicrobium sp.]